MPKGNYYLFSPLVDEKGERVVRRPKAYEYFVYNEFVGTSYGLGNTEYPILTMKKFDHDPFWRLREMMGVIENGPHPTDAWGWQQYTWKLEQAISETVKELEGSLTEEEISADYEHRY